MRIHLQSLGCRLNEAELEAWARQFRQRGISIANAGETADLLVVNTCAVTGEAVRKSRKLLRRMQRDNPRARLVVSGCAASLPDTLPEDAGIDLLVPNADKDRLVEIAAAELALPLMPATAAEPAAAALFARGRQRGFVKIQDGCRYQCTFCITTVARGAERSRTAAAICDDINTLAADGIREIVLTGVHAGGWGSDLGEDLAGLLATVLRETDVPRIRLGSVEPWGLTESFWRLFEDPRMMPHLHLPLQSGADTVLKRMARRCRRAEYERLVERARDTAAQFNITTDIIVGFPGETDAEWRQTLDAVAHIGFGGLHIFAYSPRAGTRAATLPDQVDTETKRGRSRELQALGQRLKRAVLEREVGHTRPVLIEGPFNDPDAASDGAGYTPNYLLVRVRGAGGGHLTNRIEPVRVDGVDAGGEALLGSLAG
jgi:threonylcarbamoyladenosine tRNA methylthiotransferase MtaB